MVIASKHPEGRFKQIPDLPIAGALSLSRRLAPRLP